MWRRYVRFVGPDVGADLEEELRFHLDMRVDELVERGMDPVRARAEAERRLGALGKLKEECMAIGERAEREHRRRERWGIAMQEARQAARGLLRNPGFTAVAILTLGLGIGATTAIFSVVNTVLMRPLPVSGLDRLTIIRADLPALGLEDTQLSPPAVLDLTGRTEVFESVTGVAGGERTLTGHGDPSRVATTRTLGDFFGVFGVRPVVGQAYRPETSLDGPYEIAVVSHGLWQQLSGGDPSFVGRTIELNGIAYEVIGVMPPEFRYPRQAQVWVPFQFTDRWREPQMRGVLSMTTIGRMRPGVTEERLTAALDAEVHRWSEEYHSGSSPYLLNSTGFIEYLAGPLRLILLVLMGAVVFVLLIAAANVASLQLVRAAGRSREIAVRAAIGAGRLRIARQLFMESALLSALGGLLGIGIALLILRLLNVWEPAQAMNLTGIRLDGMVLSFAAGVVVFTALAFGTVPALRAARVNPHEVLRESSRGASGGLGRSRLLRASIVVQVALALVLLLGSGLMVRTLSSLLSADPGFSPENVVTAQVSIPGTRYDTAEKALGFFDELLERVRAMPGVQSAALVWGLPFTGQNDSSPFDIPSRPAQPGDPERHAEARMVSPDYFATMRVPLLRGRDFSGEERPGSPLVTIIDQTFAEEYFPGEDPVGQQIRSYFGDIATIIGVAGRVDHDEVGDPPKAVAYYSYAHQYWSGWRSLAVRTDQPVGNVANMLRTAVADLDPNVPVYDVQTMEGRIAQSLGPRRLAMLAMGGFALLSLLLASLGVYGVMRYTTSQRTRELGIRMAMGAQSHDVVRLVVRQGMAITAIGLVIGVAAAFALSRLMAGILFGVSPHDPVSFIAAVLVLGAVALLASFIPARRATRIDPVEALRVE